ncbi:MAG: Abi family protein [bacterium]|nr:Abi family protein [bacterium]
MPAPSTFNSEVILHRLGPERLASYLNDSDNDLERALDLYAWNAQIAAAFLEDLGRLEVVLRNQFDAALTALVASRGSLQPWYDHHSLFLGKHSRNALRDIRKAKQRATDHGKRAMIHSEVISELNFGFWRFLCSPRYHTTMWVPVLAAQFPNSPSPGHAAQLRADVQSRMKTLHFLRNRVAHHKPIHRRALADDAAMIFELAQWMCLDTHAWMTGLSRIPVLLASRPA